MFVILCNFDKKIRYFDSLKSWNDLWFKMEGVFTIFLNYSCNQNFLPIYTSYIILKNQNLAQFFVHPLTNYVNLKPVDKDF
jgi:hypothetical protein